VRVLSIVDNFTHECLALGSGYPLFESAVTRVLD
jgi:hypothetical protein